MTLAICKPAIRSSAVVGDWIYGIGGVDLGRRLIYIARVTQKLTGGAYYTPPHKRRDCIYVWKGGTLSIRPTARYHSDGNQPQMKKDVGCPPYYRKANVLVSDDFRYLGENGKPLVEAKYPAIVRMVAGLRRGHRVNHDDEVSAELVRLRGAIWIKFPTPMCGNPSQEIPKRNGICSIGERR